CRFAESVSRHTEGVSRFAESVARHTESVARHSESVARHTESVTRHTESVSRHAESFSRQTDGVSRHTERRSRAKIGSSSCAAGGSGSSVERAESYARIKTCRECGARWHISAAWPAGLARSPRVARLPTHAAWCALLSSASRTRSTAAATSFA